MRTTVNTIKVNYYICERCGHEWQDKMFIVTCPKHGEFCVDCRSNKIESQVFFVCPECEIVEKELVDQLIDHYAERKSPVLTVKRPNVVIKQDRNCYWIGSETT